MIRITLRRRLVPVLVSSVLSGTCARTPATGPIVDGPAPPPPEVESQVDLPSAPALAVLDATLWMQTSAEYAALARGTWSAAARRLPEALADTSWTAALEQGAGAGTLPPAVIVDVDETVLDNSAYAARLILGDASYTDESWARWVAEAKAPPVPGAREFVLAARELGIEVFYVTNREADLEEGTRRNLEAMGFPPGERDDVYLLKGERPGWGSDKTSRRAWVAERYRVVMLAGDDLNDFTTGAREGDVRTRAQLIERYAERWGSRWIMLPNPTYGSWVSALLTELASPSDMEVMRRKIEALDPARER